MAVKVSGQPVQRSNNVIVTLSDGKAYEFPKFIEGMDLPRGIDPRTYSLVQDSPRKEGSIADYSASRAISMTQGFNGRNYADTHLEVLKSGLVVPTPAVFMSHLAKVNEALAGKGVLYDSAGNLIEGDRLKAYAHTLNHNSWVWLNAGFEEGKGETKGFKGLSLATVTGLDEEGNPIASRVALEDCLEENCLADLESLNSQGFPTKKSRTDKYEPGKTAFFWSPLKDSVARFYAVSDRAYLDCDRIACYRYDSLGVFASAEGTSQSK